MTAVEETSIARSTWAGWLHLDTAIERFDDLSEVGSASMACRFQSPGATAVFQLIARRHPALLPAVMPTDAPPVTLPDGALDQLLDHIARLVPVEGRFALQRRLLEVIDAGNRNGRFRIPIRRIPIPPIPEPPSPFQHEAFERAVALGPMIDRFIASLGYEGTLSDREIWGRILLSAMCFGGLLKAAWLLAIERALSSGPDEEFRWLDLTILPSSPSSSASRSATSPRTPDDEAASPPRALDEASTPPWAPDDEATTSPRAPDDEATTSPRAPDDEAATPREASAVRFRRWFPDPLTRLLLKQWNASGRAAMPQSGRTLAVQVMRLVRAYAQAQAFEQHVPSTFGRLAGALETRLHLHLPPFLVAYATDRLRSTSLPPAAWQRLVKPPARLRLEVLRAGDSEVFTPVADADDAPQLPTEADEVGSKGDEELWPDSFRTLARLVRRSPADQIEQRIRAWKLATAGSLPPSVACLADWVTDWLLQDHKWQRRLRPRTIYQKLNCAGARIVARLGNRDPAALGDEDDYIDLVEGVLEDIEDDSVRRRAASGMRSFCTFLAKEKKVAAMSDPGLFNVASANEYSVDANLISASTFFSALRSLTDGSLPDHSPDPEVNKALCRIAALGFFAGLRRSEAIGLRLCDLELTAGDVYLYVRPNHLRDLKSSNAFRRLPLHVLLPAEQLDALLWWSVRQKASAKRDDAPLFPTFADDSGVLDTSPKLRLITDAIQAAAGDPTLRFHHLRHSCANWMVVRLWLADQRMSLPPIPVDIREAIESGAVELAGRGQPDAWRSVLPAWFLPTKHDHDRWSKALQERYELLGHAPTNRRALNQVSQLLGHGSTDITVASYVHLLELLLGCAVRRLAPRFGTHQLAALSGLDAESVRRIKLRHRNATSDDSAARLLDAVLDGHVTQKHRRRAKRPQDVVDFRSPSKLEPPEDRYLRLLHEASALSLAGRDPRSVAEVASRYGMPVAKLSKAIRKLHQLPAGFADYAAGLSNRRRPKQEAPRSISVPRRPGEMELGRLTLATIDRNFVNRAFTKQQARTAQDQFVKLLNEVANAWLPGTHLDMHFTVAKPARRWLQFLDQLGLTSGIVVSHLPFAGPHADPAADAAWKQSLGLSYLPKPYTGRGIPGLPASSMRKDAPPQGSVLIRVELSSLKAGLLGQSKLPVLSAIRLVLAMCYVFPRQLTNG